MKNNYLFASAFSFLILIGISCPAFGLDARLAKVSSILNNPEKNIVELNDGFKALFQELEIVQKKAIEGLTTEDRSLLDINGLGEFLLELEGNFNGLVDEPLAEAGDQDRRKQTMQSLLLSVAWYRNFVYSARASIVVSAIMRESSRFCVEPKKYRDNRPRFLTENERSRILADLPGIVALFENADYKSLAIKHFLPDEAPFMDEELVEKFVHTISQDTEKIKNILSDIKLGEKIGYDMVFVKARLIPLVPNKGDIKRPPTWEYLNFYFNESMTRCVIWNWK